MYYMLFHNFLSNILFYLFIYINSQFNSFFFNFLLIIYSLNLALCLHLAINSFLLFNNFFWLRKKQNVDFFLKTQIAPTIERLWGIRSF